MTSSSIYNKEKRVAMHMMTCTSIISFSTYTMMCTSDCPFAMYMTANNKHNHFTALLILSRTTGWDSTKRNIHPLTHVTYPDHQSSFICYCDPWHLSLFNLCAWQSFCTISVQVFLGLPLGLTTSTSHSIHFFTQSVFFSQHMPIPLHIHTIWQPITVL